MLIGIDSFFDRLDLTDLSDFQLWNGGHQSVDIAHPGVIGGEPAFAGRNFLGGKFIWAHAEATNTLKSPSPWNLPALTVNTNRIAPIQKPNEARQSQVGERGFLFGVIDANMLCNRIASGARAGEFAIGAGDVINVWLGVDPDEDFTVEYWSGWADKVNSFIYRPRDDAPEQRPFAACILCRYNRVGAQLVRDPHVTATLTVPAFKKGLDTTCYSFWADAPDPDVGGVRPGPNLDFSVFKVAEMPSIWRFSDSFRDAAGVAQDVAYALDVVREGVLPNVVVPATSFMLKPAKWQPSATNLRNMGFSISDSLADATIACVNANPIPAMRDRADEVFSAAADRDGHTLLPAKNAKVVGRYLRFPADGGSVGLNEVQRLSNGGLSTFVVWERGILVPNKTSYFDVVGRGTEDATLAFNYCGDVLRVPPHTIIYFAVDYDAGDPNPDPAVIAAGGAGGPRAEALVSRYFDEVAAQRDAYVQTHPDRPYEIGVYAPGKVLEWCYKRGIVSGFWQSVSSGATGNAYGTRPWGHASRWQYQGTFAGHPLPAAWPCPIAPFIDPDVDWGDGGQWNQNDRPALNLSELEDRELAAMKAFLHQLLPGLVP